MLDTPVASTLLILMEEEGPILLLAAIIYGVTTWRKRSRAAKQRSDEAARPAVPATRSWPLSSWCRTPLC
jgi:hypothetical protein